VATALLLLGWGLCGVSGLKLRKDRIVITWSLLSLSVLLSALLGKILIEIADNVHDPLGIAFLLLIAGIMIVLQIWAGIQILRRIPQDPS